MKYLLFLLIIPFNLFAQTFQAVIGGAGQDGGTSVEQTTDGGYIISGVTSSYGSGGMDLWLIKLDANGVQQWTNTFGGNEDDFGYSIQQSTDGGYVVVGSTKSFGNGGYDVWLIKIDTSGNEVWSQTYGGVNNDEGYSLDLAADGGYIISGCTQSYGNGARDAWLLKVGENGVQQWANTYGDEENEYGVSVQRTNDGDYILFCSTAQNPRVIKVSDNGVELWDNEVEILNPDPLAYNRLSVVNVQQTSDGGYVLGGCADPIGDVDWEDIRTFILKLNTDGYQEWIQYNDESSLGGFVQQASDLGYIVAGSWEGVSEHIMLHKTDLYGNEQWSKSFFNIGEGMSTVKQTIDGGYILVGGMVETTGGSFDLFFIKTDSEGNVNFTTLLETGKTTNKTYLKTIDLLGGTIIERPPNTILIDMYDDGSVEKQIVLE